MTDHRGEAPGENGAPVPRDLPDQQTRTGEDPWEAAPVPGRAESDATDEDEGTPHPGTEPPDEREPSEHPVPDEPSG